MISVYPRVQEGVAKGAGRRLLPEEHPGLPRRTTEASRTSTSCLVNTLFFIAIATNGRHK